MLLRRIIYFLKVLVGIVFVERIKHNISSSLKRVLLFIPWYLLSFTMAVLDLLFFGELLTAIILLTSKNVRRFSSDEFEVMKSQSNDHTCLKNVRIIENSWLAKMGARLGKRKQLGLGVGRTIHFSREIDSENRRDLAWLVHQIAHTLQYKYRGYNLYSGSIDSPELLRVLLWRKRNYYIRGQNPAI